MVERGQEWWQTDGEQRCDEGWKGSEAKGGGGAAASEDGVTDCSQTTRRLCGGVVRPYHDPAPFVIGTMKGKYIYEIK
jgi:hypothetical protein